MVNEGENINQHFPLFFGFIIPANKKNEMEWKKYTIEVIYGNFSFVELYEKSKHQSSQPNT